VTFVVFDLETTGGSAGGGDAITEVGAVKVRGGEVERVGCLGATHLDDLLELPKAAGHPQGEKLRWVASLPRAPGVRE